MVAVMMLYIALAAIVNGDGYTLIERVKDSRQEIFNKSVFDEGNHNVNVNNPEANIYSIIGEIGDNLSLYRGVDDTFQFKLIWGNADNTFNTLEWKQTSWIEIGTITGFEPISGISGNQTQCKQTKRCGCCCFVGLGLSEHPSSTYMDGNAMTWCSWNAVVPFQTYLKGGYTGIPGFNYKTAYSQELYIWNPHYDGGAIYWNGVPYHVEGPWVPEYDLNGDITEPTKPRYAKDDFVIALYGELQYIQPDNDNPHAMGTADARIGSIHEDDAKPYFNQIFPVSNTFGMECTIEVTTEGDINLLAVSIPVAFYNTGRPQDATDSEYYYVSGYGQYECKGEGNCINITSEKDFFRDFNRVSLDGITYISRKPTNIETGDTEPGDIETGGDIKPIDLKEPYVIILLLILFATMGIFIGISNQMTAYFIKKRSNNNYEKLKIENYNDTETE